jgi:hypothetical protein
MTKALKQDRAVVLKFMAAADAQESSFSLSSLPLVLLDIFRRERFDWEARMEEILLW